MPIVYTFVWVISTPTVPYNTPLVWYVATLCIKMQLCLVISTPTVPYSTPLVCYVFTVYSQLASIAI